MISSHETCKWLNKFVQRLQFDIYINIKFILSCTVISKASKSIVHISLTKPINYSKMTMQYRGNESTA